MTNTAAVSILFHTYSIPTAVPYTRYSIYNIRYFALPLFGSFALSEYGRAARAFSYFIIIILSGPHISGQSGTQAPDTWYMVHGTWDAEFDSVSTSFLQGCERCPLRRAPIPIQLTTYLVPGSVLVVHR